MDAFRNTVGAAKTLPELEKGRSSSALPVSKLAAPVIARGCWVGSGLLPDARGLGRNPERCGQFRGTAIRRALGVDLYVAAGLDFAAPVQPHCGVGLRFIRDECSRSLV